MSITIVVVFTVCNSFYVIYKILNSQTMLRNFDKQYLLSTARIFAIINSSVNVIIYGAFNRKFRETFCSLFCKRSARNENPMSGIIVGKNSRDGLISNRTSNMTPLQTMNWSISFCFSKYDCKNMLKTWTKEWLTNSKYILSYFQTKNILWLCSKLIWYVHLSILKQ